MLSAQNSISQLHLIRNFGVENTLFICGSLKMGQCILEELSWKCVIWWIAHTITENMSVLGQGNKYRRKLGRNLVNKLYFPAVSPINAFQIHSQFLPILSFCQKFLPIPFTVSAVSYFLSLILSLFHKLFLQLLHIPIPSFFHKFFLTPSSFFH